MIFETIKNVFDKKNSQDATEGKDVEDVNECDEDNYPTYDIVHWIFNKHTYSRDEFSKEYNKIVEKYVDDDQTDDDDRLEEPEILVTYEAWMKVKTNFLIMNALPMKNCWKKIKKMACGR